MNDKIIRLALLGKDVSASRSKQIHQFILDELGYVCEYELLSVNREDLDFAMRRLMGDFDGFNVTVPYKRDVMAYLNEIKDDAFTYGSVNTVVAQTGVGYNTDGVGFMLMLQDNGISVIDKKVLILGCGGAGRSCAAALKTAGAKVYIYQRNKEKLTEVCAELGVSSIENPEMGGFDILINCTGVGMRDTVGQSPVTKAAFKGAKIAIDLIYRPKETEFLRLAKERNLHTINGDAMLFYQAYYSDCLYLARQADETQARALYQKYLTKYED